jgi:hypothetical protein
MMAMVFNQKLLMYGMIFKIDQADEEKTYYVFWSDGEVVKYPKDEEDKRLQIWVGRLNQLLEEPENA